MSKSVPKLQTSANHEMFVQSEFNRDLRSLDKLKASMKKYGFIPAYPLHCVQGGGGKLIVKAGHHRLEAAKQLGIPVYYVVSDDRSSISETELSSSAWTMKDFVKSFARAGSESHIAIVEFSERTGISFIQSASLLGGEAASSHNMMPRVKDGTFSLKENEHAETVASIVVALRDMGIAFANATNMVSAISSVCFLEEFDPAKFIHKAATHMHLMCKQSTMKQYLDLIERVYNFSAQQRVAIAFLAAQAAKQRNAVNKKRVGDADAKATPA